MKASLYLAALILALQVSPSYADDNDWTDQETNAKFHYVGKFTGRQVKSSCQSLGAYWFVADFEYFYKVSTPEVVKRMFQSAPFQTSLLIDSDTKAISLGNYNDVGFSPVKRYRDCPEVS